LFDMAYPWVMGSGGFAVNAPTAPVYDGSILVGRRFCQLMNSDAFLVFSDNEVQFRQVAAHPSFSRLWVGALRPSDCCDAASTHQFHAHAAPDRRSRRTRTVRRTAAHSPAFPCG
jgi:hypothetical protein